MCEKMKSSQTHWESVKGGQLSVEEIAGEFRSVVCVCKFLCGYLKWKLCEEHQLINHISSLQAFCINLHTKLHRTLSA